MGSHRYGRARRNLTGSAIFGSPPADAATPGSVKLSIVPAESLSELRHGIQTCTSGVIDSKSKISKETLPGWVCVCEPAEVTLTPGPAGLSFPVHTRRPGGLSSAGISLSPFLVNSLMVTTRVFSTHICDSRIPNFEDGYLIGTGDDMPRLAGLRLPDGDLADLP
jgi:hypothetical protein